MKDSYTIIQEYIVKPKGMMEWRQIPEFEGRYEMSNHGDVRRVYNSIVGGYGGQIVLVAEDKTRKAISIRKAIKVYWPTGFMVGREKWKTFDEFPNYEISNYSLIRLKKKRILWPNKKAGTIVLTKIVDGKEVRNTFTVLKLFLNTFPPYEVQVNEESKTVNYKKP